MTNLTTATMSATIAPELKDLPHVPIDSLEPFQGDLKELSKREYAKLKKSLLDNGIIVPFFVWKETGKILDGHQRERVFINEGWFMDVPVIYISADNEQDAKKKLLVISSQYGRVTQDGWDDFTFDLDDEWIKQTVNFDALPLVFEDWDTSGDGGESKDAEPQISRADELQEIWQVKPGQLWRLPSRVEGQEHRIICGDCTDAAVVERLMGGEKADIEIHDPPYGMRLDADWSAAKSSLDFAAEKPLFGGKKYNDVQGDHEDYDPSFLFERHTIPNEMFLWGFDYYAERIPSRTKGSVFVWDKRLDESADRMYGSCFELLWSKTKHKRDIIRFRWSGVFGVEQEPDRQRSHPTQKPVGVYEWILEKYSNNGDITGDYYLGAGSHLIAAENLSRQCRAVEIHPPYVAVTLQRYLDAFGIKPELVTS